MSKFQDELLEAIVDIEVDRENNFHLPDRLHLLISRAVDKQEVLCGVCQYNLDNHPPGPGEPNIFTYKKALELCIMEMCRPEHLKKVNKISAGAPEYWIAEAEKGSEV